jgi:CHAT domain-containing protein
VTVAAAARGERRVAVVDRLIDAARAQLRVDARRSAALAARAALIAERLDDRERLGCSLRARANALSVAGDNRTAVQLHGRALALLEAEGSDGEIARTLAASMQPLILLGEYDRALAAAARARRLYEATGDARQLARLDINVGNVHHRQDRGDEALLCYERAYTELTRLDDSDGMFLALHNKAVVFISLHRFGEAEATYGTARDLACRLARPLFLIQADYNVAWLYYLRGEYSRAIDLLRATADVSRGNGDAYHAALCFMDLSEIYLELNLSADAREVAAEATARFRTLGLPYETAKSIACTAIACGQQGKTAAAVDLFDEARRLFETEHNPVWVSLVDLYEALLLFNEGRLFESRRQAHAARDLFAARGLTAKSVLCDLLLARISLRLDDPMAAAERCAQILDALTHTDRPILRYHAHLVRGQAQAAAGRRTDAATSFAAARASLEGLRIHLRDEELKIAFIGNKLEVFEHLVDLSIEDGPSPDSAAEVFRCMEQAKSRALLELIARPAGTTATAGESDIARTIRGLREELNSYYHLLEREQLQPHEKTLARLQRFQREIGDRERELARMLRDAATADSRHAELHAPHVANPDEVRAALPTGATLIEFFQAHDRIVACVLDRTRLEVVPVAIAADVARHVQLLQFQLSKFRLGPNYLRTFGPSLLEATREHLRALFRDLLAPFWDTLRGRHLAVVPHGVLHAVPFHALIDDCDQYVADISSVSYAPSASVYVLCERQSSAAPDGALVLGIPDERAPLIGDEVTRVAAAIPGARLFVGAAATSGILRTHGSSSRIVHIAAHGFFRPDSPMFSSIRLADGYLTVHELSNLDLPADLVTLSGCGTGATTAAAGDERLGISRGLFLAGARRLLLSLWDVADGSAVTFMTNVYASMQRGTPVVHAVSEAMQELRRDHPHPYYWASFALSGKVGPL